MWSVGVSALALVRAGVGGSRGGRRRGEGIGVAPPRRLGVGVAPAAALWDGGVSRRISSVLAPSYVLYRSESVFWEDSTNGLIASCPSPSTGSSVKMFFRLVLRWIGESWMEMVRPWRSCLIMVVDGSSEE